MNKTLTCLFLKWHRNQSIDLSARCHKDSSIKVVQSSAPLERDGLLLLHVQNAATERSFPSHSRKDITDTADWAAIELFAYKTVPVHAWESKKQKNDNLSQAVGLTRPDMKPGFTGTSGLRWRPHSPRIQCSAVNMKWTGPYFLLGWSAFCVSQTPG